MEGHTPCCTLGSRQERVSTLLQGVATSYFHLWPGRVSEDFTASRLPMPPPRSSTPRFTLRANTRQSARI